MANQIMLDYSYLERLYGLVEYAMIRLNSCNEEPAVEYLEEQLTEIKSKVENERFGGGDTICVQIDSILGIFGDDDG